MSKKIRTEAVDYLFDAILSLKDKEECYTFFEDICTINELLSLSQRFEVAKMLREQKTYLEIAEKTGASTATISRVNRICGSGFFHLLFIQLIRLCQILNLNHTFPPGCAWCAVHLSYYCIIFLIQLLYFFSLYPSIDFL